MPGSTNEVTYSVNNFVADVKRIIGSKGTGNTALQAIGTHLRKLVIEGGDLRTQGTEVQNPDALPSRALYNDPDGQFRISVAQFAPDKPTPIHSHYRWGAECVISGEERFTVWELANQNADSKTAALKVVSDEHVRRGDIQVWYDPPKNVHRQWAYGEEPVCLVIILGGDGSREHLFDLEAGTYEDAPPRVATS
ncbi:hypothetical protein FIM12_07205 [SAR202 cluster bacterium AD-804-J14_MRT_500m]|nr:hypothetical protein [SAR202 cluster bacterium AD-804-J14_MRT_500m]